MLATLGIAVVGLLAIYSTSRPFLLYRGFDPYTYTQRQVIFLVIGAFVMAAVMSIDYGELKERAGGLYLLTIITLLAVLILGTGPAGSGANAWFDLGPILVQPSEFAKVTVLVLIAGYLADERTGQLTYARFISGLILVGVPVALVMLQPDFGTASVFIALRDGGAPRRRRELPLHPVHQRARARHDRGADRLRVRAGLPGTTPDRVHRAEHRRRAAQGPRPTGTQLETRHCHRRTDGKGLPGRSADQRPVHPRAVDRLRVLRHRRAVRTDRHDHAADALLLRPLPHLAHRTARP